MEYDKIAVGNRACEARMDKNLNQDEVSAAIGIHQTTYSKFENGRYNMRITHLIKLCNILDISVSWLIGENIIPDLTDNERLEVEKYIKYLKSLRNNK